MIRGTDSERQTVKMLKENIADDKDVFLDCYIPRLSGNYAQADVIWISSIGIIVFEIKDYTGFIYGKETDLNWIQSLKCGRRKFKFYNPIMQNNTHIEALKQTFPDIPVYSVIVFFGGAIFKSKRIPNVLYCWELIKNLKTLTDTLPIYKYKNKGKIRNILALYQKNGNNKEIRTKHLLLARQFKQG